jgi:site-specific DNA-methyltransferase (adenine-specific)
MSFEKVQIGDSVTLYRGDCLEVLPTLGKVELVLVDIPYGEVNRESSGLRNLDKGAADVVSFGLEDVIRFCSDLGRTAYVFCGTEQVSVLRAGFVRDGMTTRLCVWEKTNPSPMNGDRLWLSAIEACVFARRPLAVFNEHCQPPVWRGPIERNQVHPTQKPLWLMRRLVLASSNTGDCCLDFCMGSGTTGVACALLGRKFIGIEREPKYFDIACQRIEAELNRHPLFEQPIKAEAARLFA